MESEITIKIYRKKLRDMKLSIKQENYHLIKFLLREELHTLNQRIQKNLELMKQDKIKIKQFKLERENLRTSRRSIKEAWKANNMGWMK